MVSPLLSLFLSLSLSLAFLPFFDSALSFDKTSLSFLWFLVDFCVSFPHPHVYRALSYREVHNPEGLITYSSGESRYRATLRLISPTPRAPRTGVSLSTLFHERFYPSDPIPSIRRGCRLPWPGGRKPEGCHGAGDPPYPPVFLFPSFLSPLRPRHLDRDGNVYRRSHEIG